MTVKEKVHAELDLDSHKDSTTYAIFSFILDSGIEKSATLKLKHSDILFVDDKIKVRYTGRLGIVYESEISMATYGACLSAFILGFGRFYNDDDYLFYSSESYKGKQLSPMKSGALHVRFKDLSKSISCEITPRLLRNIHNNKNAKDKRIDIYNDEGYLYLIYDDTTKLTCIGQTKNVEDRIKHYRLHSPIALEDVTSFKTDNRIKEERFWHAKFSGKKSHYAWFRLSPNDILEIKDFYDRGDK